MSSVLTHSTAENKSLRNMTSSFDARHLGLNAVDISEMSAQLGFSNLSDLIDAAVPAGIRRTEPFSLPESKTEQHALASLHSMMGLNKVQRSLIGQGYHGTVTPPVIQRNILENPG